MDGTENEEKQRDGSMVLSYMPSLNEVTHIVQTGQSDPAIVSQASSALPPILYSPLETCARFTDNHFLL